MTEPERDGAAAEGETAAQEAAAQDEAAGQEAAAQIAQLQAERDEYLDCWRRAAADLSNARKRMQREQEELRTAAAERVLEKLLLIIDDVDRAFANVPPDQAGSDWVNGFRAIQRKLEAFLESEGVTPIPAAAGLTFDPAIHHAVTHETAEGLGEGQIIGEAARGYKLGDRVLRPAMVRVAKES